MGETPHQKKLRHKKELKELEARLKKSKVGKKELKKQVEELKKKQAGELGGIAAMFDAPVAKAEPPAVEGGEQKSEESPPADAEEKTDKAEETAKPEEAAAPKLSKAQRRRANKAAREAARRAEIEAEIAAENLKDERGDEAKALGKRLEPLNKRVHEIRADGHCLYSALAHQLGETEGGRAALQRLQGEQGAGGKEGYLVLRAAARAEMEENKDEYMPFLFDEAGDMLDLVGFQRYCQAVTQQEPVVWGGQPEIKALASALQRSITVHSADSPPMVMQGGGNGGEGKEGLHVSFHRHYFGLGEHYNSLIPKQ